MKNDPYFKFLAATLITAVLLAFLNPASATARPKPADHAVAIHAAPGSPGKS